MNELEPPDSHYVQAAQGWLELGNYQESKLELENISDALQKHPEVLSVRWSLFAAEQKWDESIETAQNLVDTAPEYPMGWIHRSYSLHEVKRTQEAFDLLLPAATLFPELSLIAYNLSCYCCQLGKPKESLSWLDKSLDLGDPGKIKEMALEDPDLQPIRAEIIKRTKSHHK